MKLKNLALTSAILASTLLTGQEAKAAFGTNLATDPAGTTRLFNSPGDPSESGSLDSGGENDPIWLVFDVNQNGTVFNPGVLSGTISYDGTLLGLLSTLIEPGDLVYQRNVSSAVQGQTSQNITGIDALAQTGGTGTTQRGGILKPSYTILFDDNTLTDGGSFGFAQNTVTANIPTSTGNAALRIQSDIFADSYSFNVTPIPEPSTAMLAGLGLGLVALYSRRNRRS